MESNSDSIEILNNLEEMQINEDTLPDFDFTPDFFCEKIVDEDRLNKRDLINENRLKSIEESKKKRREKTRAKRKENKKKKLEAMSKEERYAEYRKKEEKEKIKMENLKLGLESQYKIVFDLDYLNLMRTVEIKSLASQMSYCYSLNKTIKNPFLYYFCSYKGEAKKEMESMGSVNWYAKFYEEKFSEVDEIINSGRDLVYLSPDSPNILTEVNEKSIYIIGGFVDKPVSKFRSLDKANGLNIKSARLPLDDYLNNLVNPVLNINNVVEILASYIETQNWETTIKGLVPGRMLK